MRIGVPPPSGRAIAGAMPESRHSPRGKTPRRPIDFGNGSELIFFGWPPSSSTLYRNELSPRGLESRSVLLNRNPTSGRWMRWSAWSAWKAVGLNLAIETKREQELAFDQLFSRSLHHAPRVERAGAEQPARILWTVVPRQRRGGIGIRGISAPRSAWSASCTRGDRICLSPALAVKFPEAARFTGLYQTQAVGSDRCARTECLRRYRAAIRPSWDCATRARTGDPRPPSKGARLAPSGRCRRWPGSCHRARRPLRRSRR